MGNGTAGPVVGQEGHGHANLRLPYVQCFAAIPLRPDSTRRAANGERAGQAQAVGRKVLPPGAMSSAALAGMYP
jgi:hypothetical protein